MLRTLLTVATLACSTFAQSTLSVSATSTSASSNTTYPTKTIFLPLSNLGNIAGSIITAAPNSTVYGLACLYATTSHCPYNASVTLTEGESTLIYTESDSASPATKGPTTINCALAGGTSATSIVCTGASSVSGLGVFSSSSTIAGGLLSYVPVTITAGAEELSSVATETAASATAAAGSASSSSSKAAGAVATAGAWVAGGAAGMALLGVL